MQSNGISWNPQQAMIFTVANEDNNLYSFDLRNVSTLAIVKIYKIKKKSMNSWKSQKNIQK